MWWGFGGDEFAVVLLAITDFDAIVLFDRLHRKLHEMMRGRGWNSGVSIGVVTFSDTIPDIKDVISYADTLMYKAKENGKGRLIFEESARCSPAGATNNVGCRL